MKFDEKNLFTVLNREKAKVGSKGYFFDNLHCFNSFLDGEESNVCYGELIEVSNENDSKLVNPTEYPFLKNIGGEFQFFYLIEEPTEDNSSLRVEEKNNEV